MQRILVVVALCAGLSACAQRSTMFVDSDFGEGVDQTSCSEQAPLDRPVKVANYNIKSGLWTSFDDVLGVIEEMDADILALEEVDNGMERSGGVDQSAVIAEAMHGERVFAGAWEKDEGAYGVALVSKLPVVRAERVELPDAGNLEPRVAIDATVCAGDQPLRVVSTHADVLPWAATAHAKFIAEHVEGDSDVLVMGDLNTEPASDGVKSIVQRGLADVLARFVGDRPTFPQTSSRIDYILTDRDVEDAHIIESEASDHYPIAGTLPLATGAE
jgi:endonuclease/exonuclease/phosphatase family metal-dependent hydrolase